MVPASLDACISTAGEINPDYMATCGVYVDETPVLLALVGPRDDPEVEREGVVVVLSPDAPRDSEGHVGAVSTIALVRDLV